MMMAFEKVISLFDSKMCERLCLCWQCAAEPSAASNSIITILHTRIFYIYFCRRFHFALISRVRTRVCVRSGAVAGSGVCMIRNTRSTAHASDIMNSFFEYVQLKFDTIDARTISAVSVCVCSNPNTPSVCDLKKRGKRRSFHRQRTVNGGHNVIHGIIKS